MKLSKAREHYEYFSEKSSDIARNLGFAGIALIWVFKVEVDGESSVPSGLLLPAFFLIVGLVCDFLHYVLASLLWGAFGRFKEKAGIAQEADVEASRYINYPAIVLFWTKLGAMLIAYFFILRFLIAQLGGETPPA